MKKAKIKGVPHRKISETFLDFAAPLLKDLPGDAPEIPAHNALIVCFTAWNAVIFSDVLKDDYCIEEVHRLTAGEPEAALLLKQMMSRKRELFAEDVRLIGNWEVTRTIDDINLHAEAIDPHSVKRNRPDPRFRLRIARGPTRRDLGYRHRRRRVNSE